jgi:hypothetical protein
VSSSTSFTRDPSRSRHHRPAVPAHPPTGQEVMMIDVDWRQPFIDYLSEQKIPSDKNLAE